jgi:hypothetical protein
MFFSRFRWPGAASLASNAQEYDARACSDFRSVTSLFNRERAHHLNLDRLAGSANDLTKIR